VIFFTAFVVSVLGVVALMLLVDEAPERRTASPGETRPLWPDAVAVFSDNSVRPVIVLAMAFGLVTISDAFIYLLLVQRAGTGPEWIPLLYTGTAVSFLALAIPVGYIADRIGRQWVFVVGHVLLALSYVAAFGGFNAWPWNAVMCVLLLGAYYASSDGVLAGLASGLLPTRDRAVGLAWVATAVSVARLCSAVTFGFLWTRAGDRIAVLTFTVALTVVLAIALTRRDIERPATP